MTAPSVTTDTADVPTENTFFGVDQTKTIVFCGDLTNRNNGTINLWQFNVDTVSPANAHLIGNNVNPGGTGTGLFLNNSNVNIATLLGLTYAQHYFWRARATNTVPQTGFGATVEAWLSDIPSVTAGTATGTSTTITPSGSVSWNGLSPYDSDPGITALKFNLYNSSLVSLGSANATAIVQSGSFSATFTGLSPATLYWWLPVATSSYGSSSFSSKTSYTTSTTPTINTLSATVQSWTTVLLSVNVASNGAGTNDTSGGPTVTSTAFDVYASDQTTLIGTSSGSATSGTSTASVKLAAGTVYYWKAKATNGYGTTTSAMQGPFTMQPNVFPLVTQPGRQAPRRASSYMVDDDPYAFDPAWLIPFRTANAPATRNKLFHIVEGIVVASRRLAIERRQLVF